MKVSLPGLLKNAAAQCKKTGAGVTAGSLLEMLDHLRQVRAEPIRMQHFLDLYVDEGFAAWLAEHPEHAAKKPSPEQMIGDFMTAMPIETRPHCAVCGEVLCSKPACQPKDF